MLSTWMFAVPKYKEGYHCRNQCLIQDENYSETVTWIHMRGARQMPLLGRQVLQWKQLLYGGWRWCRPRHHDAVLLRRPPGW